MNSLFERLEKPLPHGITPISHIPRGERYSMEWRWPLGGFDHARHSPSKKVQTKKPGRQHLLCHVPLATPADPQISLRFPPSSPRSLPSSHQSFRVPNPMNPTNSMNPMNSTNSTNPTNPCSHHDSLLHTFTIYHFHDSKQLSALSSQLLVISDQKPNRPNEPSRPAFPVSIHHSPSS